MEGKPLAFGQLSVELLAVPAPDRTGEPVARNCLFGPHPACPCIHRPCCGQVWTLREKWNRTLAVRYLRKTTLGTESRGLQDYVVKQKVSGGRLLRSAQPEVEAQSGHSVAAVRNC